MMEFQVEAWAACAPGLLEPAAWRAWAAQPHLPAGTVAPVLATVPPMLRRRLDPLGRVALQAAYDCQRDAAPMPTVFASRYGEANRAAGLLADLTRHSPLSPTDFSLSVHNAVAALYSIARHDTSPYAALAAGRYSAEAALTEATCVLAAGAPAVLVVVYDGPLPNLYTPYADKPECLFAWAWRVVPRRPGSTLYYSLTLEPGAPEPDAPPSLPMALDVLRFFLADDPAAAPTLMRPTPLRTWCWRRHG